MTQEAMIMSGVHTAIGDFRGALPGAPRCDLTGAGATEATARVDTDPVGGGQTVLGNVIHTEPRDTNLPRVALAGVDPARTGLATMCIGGQGIAMVVGNPVGV